VVQPQIEATYSREYRVVGPDVAAHCATSGLTITSASSSGVTARRMGSSYLRPTGAMEKRTVNSLPLSSARRITR
jgi:hypothetical protein